jgi:hypothetical protein
MDSLNVKGFFVSIIDWLITLFRDDKNPKIALKSFYQMIVILVAVVITAFGLILLAMGLEFLSSIIGADTIAIIAILLILYLMIYFWNRSLKKLRS